MKKELQIKKLKKKLKAKEKTLMVLTHRKEAQGPSTQNDTAVDDETKLLRATELDAEKQEPSVPETKTSKVETIWDTALKEQGIKHGSSQLDDFFNDWMPQEPASPFVDRMLNWDGDHLDKAFKN